MKKLFFAVALLILVMSVSAMATDLLKFDMEKCTCDWAIQNNLEEDGIRSLVAQAGWGQSMSLDNPFGSAGNTSVRLTNSGYGVCLHTYNSPVYGNTLISMNPNGTNQLTMQAWVKVASLSGGHDDIFVMRWPNGEHLILWLDPGTAKPKFTINMGSIVWHSFVADNPIPLNQWVHLAATYDNGDVKIYVNAQEVASYDGPNTPIPTDTLKPFAGDGGNDGLAMGYHLDGWIDDVMVSDTLIDPAQLGYHAPFTPILEATPNSGIALYNMDCVVGDVQKRIINSLNSSSYLNAPYGGLNGWEGMSGGGALVLDDDDPFNSLDSRSIRYVSGTYTEVYPVSEIDFYNGGRNQFTLEGWIKPSSYSSGNIISMGEVDEWGAPRYFAIGMRADGTAFFRAYAGEYAPNIFDAASTSAIPLDAWTHIAGVYDGANLRLYVNAVLTATCPIAAFDCPVFTTARGNVNLGNGLADALLDDVRVTQGALDPSELGYHGCLSHVETLETATIATYNMDTLLAGNTVSPDSSGNGYDINWMNSGSMATTVELDPDDPFNAEGNYSYKSVVDTSVSWPGNYGERIGNIPKFDVFNSGYNQFTVEAWVKPSVFDKHWGIANIALTDHANNYHCVRFGLYPDGTVNIATLIYAWHWAQSPSPLPLNQWSHIAATYNAEGTGILKLYVNAIEVASAYAGDILSSNPTAINVGGAGGLGYGSGLIDDVRFSKKALPVSELGYFKSLSAPVEPDPDPSSIAEARNAADDTAVNCTAYVTAKFGSHFYIEEADRFAGIRIEGSDSGFAIGQKVQVIGNMDTLPSTERCINATKMNGSSESNIIPALGMNVRSAGSETGLSSLGLLIKTWGKVTSPSTDSFVIDDGSGNVVKVIMPAGTYIPAEGTYGCVTGISSCENEGGSIVRTIKSLGRVAMPENDNGIIDDTFTGRTIMGFTEDASHYPWIGDSGSTVAGGYLNCNKLDGISIASISDYKPADFTLETSFRINNPDSTNAQAVIVMRQGAPNSIVAGGYFLAILPKWNNPADGFNEEPGWLLMWHDGTAYAHNVAFGHLDGINWSNFHSLEITAVGNSWSGKFDGTPIFTNVADYGFDPSGTGITTTGGYIGFGEIISNVDYDYVHITKL